MILTQAKKELHFDIYTVRYILWTTYLYNTNNVKLQLNPDLQTDNLEMLFITR